MKGDKLKKLQFPITVPNNCGVIWVLLVNGGIMIITINEGYQRWEIQMLARFRISKLVKLAEKHESKYGH